MKTSSSKLQTPKSSADLAESCTGKVGRAVPSAPRPLTNDANCSGLHRPCGALGTARPAFAGSISSCNDVTIQPCNGRARAQRPQESIHQSTRAFTLIEIAICLAVIGFALVAIIGILPMGMQVQKDNRQETIINQDSSMWLDFIRNGTKHADDLTNYVYAITNYYTVYSSKGQLTFSRAVGFVYTSSSTTPEFPVTVPITNGNIILGLLTTPKYVAIGAPGEPPSYRSNFVVAYVRSMSGAASERFPQTNPDIQASAFAYRMAVDLVPYSDFDRDWTNFTSYLNSPNTNEWVWRSNYFVLAKNYQNNLYDLRLTFRWPLDPRGTPGAGKQSYRTLASGQLIPTNEPPGIANLITTYSLLSRTYGTPTP